MLTTLLAALSYSLPEIAIGIIILAAIVAVVFIAVRAMGIAIPQWVVHIAAVVGIVILAVLAIRVIASL